ncbi:hypothetical protein WAI453_002659 [Rhynchosporium graminicola]
MITLPAISATPPPPSATVDPSSSTATRSITGCGIGIGNYTCFRHSGLATGMPSATLLPGWSDVDSDAFSSTSEVLFS